jgi:asparagine synthase (glutamine-hydrolysing)
MSGIAGILNLNGAPVDRRLLRRMTGFLAFRGPDAQETWIDGPVGFGHTMLRTTFESEREQQPCTLDGQVWITADARIDGRKELIPKLEGHGRGTLTEANDAELILHSWHVWGEDCLQHLIGDFAFAIWDGRNQRLFCARDHFGVKPFFYARVGHTLVFSNTLNCVRLHPDVSDELNELAIADFLLFDFNQELDTTTFAGINRLAPAHQLSLHCGNSGPVVRRYWTLPTDGHIRYRRSSEYVDHFRELLQTSVEDRLRTNRVGVFMSGGLDSTAVAAVAHRLLKQKAEPYDLRAYTVVYDRLIPDQERYYSGLAAKGIGIPIHYLAADDYQLFERREQTEAHLPEPDIEPLRAMVFDQYKQVVAESRVALTGYGGDPALYPSQSYLLAQLRQRRFASLALELIRYIVSSGNVPKLGVRSAIKRWLGRVPETWQPVYPAWLNQDFARRLHLRDRWERINKPPAPAHPVRPEAYQRISGPFWPYRFESQDPGLTTFPLEVRHPLFDTRLVGYLMALPPIPWCLHKELLRAATRGLLPETIRTRPKTPLAGDPLFERLRLQQRRLRERIFDPPGEMASFVDPNILRQTHQEDPTALWTGLRPVGLAHFLNNQIERKVSCYETTIESIG